MNESEEIVEKFQRDLLSEKLALCTPEQQEFFKKLYPSGVSKDRLNWAIQQCINTIKKNNKKET